MSESATIPAATSTGGIASRRPARTSRACTPMSDSIDSTCSDRSGENGSCFAIHGTRMRYRNGTITVAGSSPRASAM